VHELGAIAQAQQEFFGLIPDAMAAVRYALRVEKNPTIAVSGGVPPKVSLPGQLVSFSNGWTS
jgi:hypothetical protein